MKSIRNLNKMYWILKSDEDVVFFVEKNKTMSLCFEKGDIKKSIYLSKKSFNALKGMSMGVRQPTTQTNLPQRQKVEKIFEMITEVFE